VNASQVTGSAIGINANSAGGAVTVIANGQQNHTIQGSTFGIDATTTGAPSTSTITM